jgi:hypothetical protein
MLPCHSRARQAGEAGVHAVKVDIVSGRTTRAIKACGDWMVSQHALIFLFEHDLFEEPLSTFSDHALGALRHL